MSSPSNSGHNNMMYTPTPYTLHLPLSDMCSPVAPPTAGDVGASVETERVYESIHSDKYGCSDKIFTLYVCNIVMFILVKYNVHV